MADLTIMDRLRAALERANAAKPEYGQMSPELSSQANSGGLLGGILRTTNPMMFDPNSAWSKWTRSPVGTPMGEAAMKEALPAVVGSSPTSPGSAVYRFSRSSERPSNSVPFTFWADSPVGLSSTYGPNGWTATTENLPHVKDIYKEIRQKMAEQNREGMLPAGITMNYAKESSLNPDNIVSHAGAWDDANFVSWFAENFGDKYPGVKTADGAIILDDSFIKNLKKFNEFDD